MCSLINILMKMFELYTILLARVKQKTCLFDWKRKVNHRMYRISLVKTKLIQMTRKISK